MPDEWKDDDWKNLVLSIKVGQCTPFIGSGACYGILPTGRSLAKEWAREIDYPFPDDENLPKVAQYLAVEQRADVPRNRIVDRFRKAGSPDFSNPLEPHCVLADLHCSIYITTNYDDFMYRALLERASARGDKKFAPMREYCRWNEVVKQGTKAKIPRAPAPESPLVYHLHGVLDKPASLVITEDDYLEFMVDDSRLIPEDVKSALSNTSLLFVGYSLEDLNFKLILRRVTTYMRRAEGARHVSVQIAPKAKGEPPSPEELARAERQRLYLTKHFGLQRVDLYWGSAADFAKELAQWWAKS